MSLHESLGTAVPKVEERIAATSRPPGTPVMHQRWADLLFVHWEVPAASLAPLLPPGLDVDTFGGRAYVGLVPFTVAGARLRGFPALPFLSRFHEVNLRTYVHRGGRDPGVWFFSLDAANAAVVQVARVWFRLAYRFATIRMSNDAAGMIRFDSRRRWPGPLPATCAVRYKGLTPPAAALPGTLEHFLVERYRLYAWSMSGLFQARVHHPAYPLQDVSVEGLEETLSVAAGVAPIRGDLLAHYSSGVTVEVFPLTRV